MKKEDRHPHLHQTAKDLRRIFGGKIYGNRGFVYSIANKSREPNIEIGLTTTSTWIAIEGIQSSNVSVTTNKKNRRVYPNIHRVDFRKKTFYLDEDTTPETLDTFIDSLPKALHELALKYCNWFNHDHDAWFLDIPTIEKEEILKAIDLVEEFENHNKTVEENGGQASPFRIPG